MRHKGVLSQWNDDRGFGFITPKNGGQRIFVHIKGFSNPHRRPSGNEKVCYQLASGKDGKLQAVNVAPVQSLKSANPRAIRTFLSFFIIFMFFGILSTGAMTGEIPVALLWLYLTISFITFLAYGWDKNSAIHDRRRLPESNLHLLELAGGWPGALLAQRLLRHKAVKRSYQITFWSCVLLNTGAVCWLYKTDQLSGLLSPFAPNL